ncbi:homocysteine S-methyltransferase [Paenibacillus kandeliae]|uniref:homocysteine S-methyltransferase n=1 Tax=Paenibacillus kandeliae TaxID=3231269 RepID=UPI0034587A7E
MNQIQQLIDQYGVMILDGAMATELEKEGADLNDELWSARLLLDNPDAIARVHTRYFEAGADCAITASYQATVMGFMERGLSEHEAVEMMDRSVRLAVGARDAFWNRFTAQQAESVSIETATSSSFPARPKPLIAASVGPYGAYLADGSEYRGDYGKTEQELFDFHYDRIRILIEAGADVLACETIPCLVEAQAIVRVLEHFPGVYAWISFSGKDGHHISNGESVAECAAWLEPYEQVAAVGINCTALGYIPALIGQIKQHTSKPIIVYPNSGEQYDPITKTWHGQACDHVYGQDAMQWYELGARLIGGCCRTTPDDIASIQAALRPDVN